MTPSVLTGSWVSGGSITEIGNTKRGEGGGGGMMSCLELLVLQSFCATQAVVLQGSEKDGFVAQATDLGLQI